MTKIAPFLRDKHVAIIGGGPAGLTLARLLQMRGASVSIYERDHSPESRNQGGSLDLHELSGQLALREAELDRDFHRIARHQGQHFKVFDKHGTQRVEMRAEDEDEMRPEVDRGELRDLLLRSLEPGTVNWGHELLQVVTEDTGTQRLDFCNGASVRVDLVVGCDGTWSRVRPLISALKPAYSGVTFIETRLTAVDTLHPALATLVGPGSILALGDNKGLMAQRNGDGTIRVYVALRVAENWVEQTGIDFHEPLQARNRLLDLFTGWSPEIVDLLRASDDVFLPRPLYTFPPEQSWTTCPGITILGDAAHVMPPFTGQGANLAMLDAVDLTRCLTSHSFADLTEAIRAFEQTMLTRMTPAIHATLASQDQVIAHDAPTALVESINAHLEAVKIMSASRQNL
ncbi:NAD(P)/FAD-dependent oxidoreductase [Caballeronia sp. dw_19]|uniref:FAD-dependent oxidoreductase n=1 Tax=Caballeronia sp. dw_19 TaxID=2719791 RepID=UPI001BD36922